MAFRITTDAVAVGPYTVVFGVPSVTDEETFNALRVFHAEPDEFDPDNAVWVDRTARTPDAPASDFSHKKIVAYSEELETGIYVIGKLTEKIPPSSAVADVEVVGQRASGAVQMPANITLSMVIKNNGPQAATDVGLRQELPRGDVISIKASQGFCKSKPFRVFCKLGQLRAGDSATVAVEIDPSPDFKGVYSSSVQVAGKEKDSNPDNNQGSASVDTLGDPNLPPVVTLESPDMEELFEQGATVVFKATANDPDGSVTKVEFLDNDASLGIGATNDAKHFSLSSNQLANGPHVLNAIATDNGGRRTRSNAKHVFVNGPIKIRILEPKADSLIAPGSDVILTAEATDSSRSIKTVEFFTVGIPLGQATPIGDNRFTLKLSRLERARYSIEAVARDESGSISKSPQLKIVVSNRPSVRIIKPAPGANLISPVNIEVSMNPQSTDSMDRVEIYANGVLVEEGPMLQSGKYAFTWRDVKVGEYALKAIVIDSIGVRAESSPVNVIVKVRGEKSQ